jgi:hypothetical protein
VRRWGEQVGPADALGSVAFAPNDLVWLLIVYKKSKFDNLPTSFIAELKRAIEGSL